MKNPGKLTTVLIAAFSLLLVFGALLTALAETGFTAFTPTKTPAGENSGNPTPTAIFLPTKEEQPTKVQPTTPPDKTKSPTKTTLPTKTATFTATSTTTAEDPGTCTKPTGWQDYKVKSGDTLFSISKLYQTDVPTIKSGNCLTSTQIITGQILWVPDNATLVPTKTPKPTATKEPKPTSDGCHVLTLSHLGEGADAVATPLNSDGCATGKYKAGEIISLVAAPDPGWEVSGWHGTMDDSSTALTNTVKMPDKDHLAKPVYTEIITCYLLSVSSDANGSDPVPDKPKSSGCNAWEYVEGEVITFSATPNSGYAIDTWTGTDSGTNVLTMPATATTVSVTYAAIPPVCYPLTLGITSGSGTVPTAPTSSSGCSAGEYAAGEVILVTGHPASGSVVDSWQTSLSYNIATDPNAIEVTMSASAATVNVTYNP
jgi:LysM repeat protein